MRSSAWIAAFALVASLAIAAHAQNGDDQQQANFQAQQAGNIIFQSFPLAKTLTCSTNRDCQSGEVCASGRCALLIGQLQGANVAPAGIGASASIGGLGASASVGTGGITAGISSANSLVACSSAALTLVSALLMASL